MPTKISSPGHARRRSDTRFLALSLALALTAAGATTYAFTAGAGQPRGSRVELAVHGGTAVVDTATLAVRARTGDGRDLTLSDASGTDLGAPGPVTRTGEDRARWSYPERGIDVTARTDHGRLSLRMKSARDTSVSWPVTGTDAASTSLQLPRGEGLDVPVDDAFWTTGKGGLGGSTVDVGEGLTLPLWGYSLGGRTGVSYLTPTDIGTTLGFTAPGGRLRTTARHTFDGGDGTRDYTVTFALTDGNAVAPAADYRSYLAERGRLGSLKRKIAKNPATGKLLGAFHAYTWGEARTADGVERLRKLGVDRMWLGYDGEPYPDGAAVSAAKKAGYLTGPYDSFANGQDPKSADAPNSRWPGTVYPDFCVRDAHGKPETGFGGRGCYLSSAAFEKAEPRHHYLADRTRAMVAGGADSYFLDVDATGELFRDHGKGHRMTKAEDREHRLARMRRIAETGKGLVLGSETAQAWANQVLAFDHGGGTPAADGLWALQKDREKWGGYYPENAPGVFFKPVDLPADLAKAMYDPRYRVPLYETALHGSLVNTERWELGYEKLPDQKKDRALLAMLDNTPLNYVLDGPSLTKHGAELAALQKYFSPLHKAAGTEPLTSYRRLSADRTVQRTVFGRGTLTVTANFGTKAYEGLPGGCVDARLKGDDAPRRLCPGKLG
ncbi:glycoside hydrolase [Streptomyces formicae]|uniref:Lipoprotein, putative n=1 Tax=Streptomyces formicae TaxID=1616117 RepID=A0A291Q684_9ACTN|nr:glycoside hydrolase [Streptomyces formicae]ATL27300.1 lipoprotein, putative [Streptomyces formicae]